MPRRSRGRFICPRCGRLVALAVTGSLLRPHICIGAAAPDLLGDVVDQQRYIERRPWIFSNYGRLTV